MQKSLKIQSLLSLFTNPIIFLILLNLVVFHKYWLGISTPPWDFLGGGMVEQYRFYKDGGFLNPPSWFPYAWFGIPEYQMLQDGGWFLPVAFVAEIFGWYPANAARVQAFLMLLGSIGTYFLSSRFIEKSWINLIAGVLYTFIPAFYSNAQHYGVVRSAALLPWLLYFLHPKTTQSSKWSVLGGSLIIFQTIVGSYPGNLVSSFYTAVLFIILFGLISNGQKMKYLQSVFIMGLSGLLMGLLRYLPVLRVQDSFPSEVGNQAGITTYNLNYLIFPFVGQDLPWQDLTLRSLYIGSFLLPLLFFFQKGIKNSIKWIVILGFSIIMMSQSSVNLLLRELLPLTDISRFAITDWRNTFNLSIILLGTLVLNKIGELNTLQKTLRTLIFIGSLTYIVYTGNSIGHTLISTLIYPVFALLAFVLFLNIDRAGKYFKYIAVTFASIFGIIFVFHNGFSWMTTVKEQNFNIYNIYTNPFTDEFEFVNYPLIERPARFTFLPTPLTEENYKNDQRYNRFWLTGSFGAFGYHNIKDINAYSSLFPRLEKQSDPVVKFLLSGSKQVATIELKDIEQKLSNCTKDDNCIDFIPVKIEQQVFDKQSEVFKIEATEDFIMIQNEIFSPIWSGEICSESGCEKVSSFAVLDSLRSWELPKGEYIFKTQAQTPLNLQRWILFFAGVIIALLSVKRSKINKV
jgi:hypothetical protein